jgi:hypothetical protein
MIIYRNRFNPMEKLIVSLSPLTSVIPEALSDPPPTPSVLCIDPVTLGLSNIATGSHDTEIFDGVGRLVVHTAITAGPSSSFVIATQLSPGVYWTRIDGRPSGALVKIR